MAHRRPAPQPSRKRVARRWYFVAVVVVVVAMANVWLLHSFAPSFSASSYALLARGPWYEPARTRTLLHLGSSSSPAPSAVRRRVVMCAFDDTSLQLAWTQVQALRTFASAGGPPNITVYHVDELVPASRGSQWMGTEEPGVQVVTLAPWLATWTGRAFAEKGKLALQPGKIPLKKYQGFLCKAAGLLHAAGMAAEVRPPEEEEEALVAVLDVEAVLFHDPFVLAETPIFHQTGAYLFSDRRLSRGREGASFHEYEQLLTYLYKGYHAGASPTTTTKLPAALTESSIFQHYSWDYGESALLLFDVRRHAATTLPALQWLLTVNSPLLTHFAYGDKEDYWFAMALAGVPMQMNPWLPSAVGPVEQLPTRAQKERVCSWANSLAQATPAHGLFYLNGEGLEHWIVGGDRFLLDEAYLSASQPFDLRQGVSKELFKERNMCTTGSGVRLPDWVKAQLQAYRDFFLACPFSANRTGGIGAR